MLSSDAEAYEPRTSPTVTKEKWLLHAESKLAQGYVLIVSGQRRSSNFYRAGTGYESCPYKVAQQLIRDGRVVEVGQHYFGPMYRAAPDSAPAPRKPRRKARQEAVDVEDVTGSADDDLALS